MFGHLPQYNGLFRKSFIELIFQSCYDFILTFQTFETFNVVISLKTSKALTMEHAIVSNQ